MGLAASTTKQSLFFIYSHPILFWADYDLSLNLRLRVGLTNIWETTHN